MVYIFQHIIILDNELKSQDGIGSQSIILLVESLSVIGLVKVGLEIVDLRNLQWYI